MLRTIFSILISLMGFSFSTLAICGKYLYKNILSLLYLIIFQQQYQPLQLYWSSTFNNIGYYQNCKITDIIFYFIINIILSQKIKNILKMISYAKITTSEQSQNKMEIKCTLKNEMVIDNIDQTSKISYVHVIHNPHGIIIQKTIKQSSLHKATQIKNTQIVQQEIPNLKVEIVEETQKRSTSPIQKLISQQKVQIRQRQLIEQNKIAQINKSPRKAKPIFPKIQQKTKQNKQIQQQNTSFISVKSKDLNKQIQINQYSHIQAINQQDMGCSIFSDFLSRKSVIKTNITQNGNRNQRSLSNRKKIFSKQKVPRKLSIKKQQILQQLIKLRPKQRKTSTDFKQTSTTIKKLKNQSNQKLNQSSQKQNIEPTKHMIKKLGGNRLTTKSSATFHKLVSIQITKLASLNPLSF